MKHPHELSGYTEQASNARSSTLKKLGRLVAAGFIIATGAEIAQAQETEPTPDPNERYSTISLGTPNVRNQPSINGAVLRQLNLNAPLEVSLAGEADGYEWARIWRMNGEDVPAGTEAFVAVRSLDNTVVFLSELVPLEEEQEAIAIPEAPTENTDIETTATQIPGTLNEPQITGTPEVSTDEILARPYDSEIGGFIREENGQTFVYREGLQRVREVGSNTADGQFDMTKIEGEGPLADAIVADRYVTSNGLGTMTLEAPALWRDLPYAEQNNALSFTHTPEAQQNLENGMREFWITMYERAFNVDEAQAIEMLAHDEVIELHWSTNIQWAKIRGSITPDIERVLQLRPSQGISFVITPDAIDYYHTSKDVQPYPIISPTSFYPMPEGTELNMPADTFGFDASPDGRLIFYTEFEADDRPLDSFTLGYQIVGTLTQAYSFVGENGNQGAAGIGSMGRDYLGNSNKPQFVRDLALAMNMGDFDWNNTEYYGNPIDLTAQLPIFSTETPFHLEARASYDFSPRTTA